MGRGENEHKRQREKRGGEVEQKGGWVMTVSRVTTGGTERRKGDTFIMCKVPECILMQACCNSHSFLWRPALEKPK